MPGAMGEVLHSLVLFQLQPNTHSSAVPIGQFQPTTPILDILFSALADVADGDRATEGRNSLFRTVHPRQPHSRPHPSD